MINDNDLSYNAHGDIELEQLRGILVEGGCNHHIAMNVGSLMKMYKVMV